MKAFVRFVQRAWLRAHTRRLLHGMDDRMLKDIGLSRDQVRSLRF